MARVLFVQDSLYESFGPQLLAAAAAGNGHESDLIILACEGRRALTRTLRRLRPDVVAFSISSFGYDWSLEAARTAKEETGALTVFGGPHPTFAPEFARRPEVDVACRGEGEGAFLDLLDALDRGADITGIPNLVVKGPDGSPLLNPVRPLVSDLDTIPFPDRRLHFKYATLRKLPYKRFLVGRGCPYGCTYCFNKAAREMYHKLGRYVRHRSPANVVEEILDVHRRWGIGTVGFVDDTFTTDKRWVLEFLDLYRREVKLPFTCLVRANELDEEVASALGAAGCRYASFGVEVGNERIRNTILGRRMSDEQIRRAASLLHASGVKFLTYNMFGVPGETLEDGIRTVRLNAEIRADLVGSSVFQPLIGTESFEYCRREGFLDEEYRVEDFDRITTTSPLRNMPDLPHLERLHKIAFLGVHFPRAIPLLARLARVPLGPLYTVLFKLSLFLRFKVRFNLSLADVIRIGLRSRGRFG